MQILGLEKVREKLNEHHLPTNELMEKFWRIDGYGTVLTWSVFLEQLIIFVENRNNSLNFSKFNFYKYFFDKITEEDQEYRVKLQKLALKVEIKQTNEFDVVEFEQLLSKVGLSRAEVEKAEILVVYENGKIGFCHHTISEFLVAEMWIGGNGVLPELEKLIIKDYDEVLAIAFSWFGVIRFLLDSTKGKEVFKWLMKIGVDNMQIIDDGFCDTISSINPDELSPSDCLEMFDLIYRAYAQKKVWIPIWTRASLPYFCQKKNYELIKKEVDKLIITNTDNLIKVGTVVDIIARLMENNSPLVIKDKEWWKSKLIKYIDDGNGNSVLQRRALAALATYKNDIDLIAQTKHCFNSKDNLVREAFLDFCSDVAPESIETIRFLVLGFKNGEDIYSRNGIYKIRTVNGLKIFLRFLINDTDLLINFLDKESIFNNDGGHGDDHILEIIKENIGEKTIQKLLKRVLKKSFENRNIRSHEKSYFLKSLAKTIESIHPNYIFEVISDINNQHTDKSKFVYYYVPLFSWLLSETNVERFYQTLTEFDELSSRYGHQAILKSRFVDERGRKAYEKAIRVSIVEKQEERDWEKEQKEKIHTEFLRLLGNSKKKTYYPTVFKYYNQNEKIINELSDSRSKNRLVMLVVNEALKKIDPRKFTLKVGRNTNGLRTSQYSISKFATYFGDVIKSAMILGVPIDTITRQRIIDYIPFAYSDDWKVISESIGEIDSNDLKWVDKQYLTIDGDIRYFMPDAYIYIVKQASESGWKLRNSKKVLKSFVEDTKMADHQRQYALEVLEKYISAANKSELLWLTKGFNNKILRRISDNLLISIYKDNDAIRRRIEEIKEFANTAKGFEEPAKGIMHSVGEIEDEFNSLNLAQPFIKIGTDELKKQLMELLDFSVELLRSDAKNKYSAQYIWRVWQRYFLGVSVKKNSVLSYIDGWLDAKSEKYTVDGFTGFYYIYNDLKKVYFGAIPIENASSSEPFNDNKVKLCVYVEGKTDVKYIIFALKLFKKENIINTIYIDEVGHNAIYSDKKTIQYASEKDLAHPEYLSKPTLYLVDIGETNLSDRDAENKVFRRNVTIPISTNPIGKGVENLFTSRIINEALVNVPQYIEKTTYQNSNGKVVNVKFRIRDKDGLCDWICKNGTANVFKKFKLITQIIEQTIAQIES